MTSIRGGSAALSPQLWRRLAPTPLVEDSFKTWLAGLSPEARRAVNTVLLIVDEKVSPIDVVQRLVAEPVAMSPAGVRVDAAPQNPVVQPRCLHCDRVIRWDGTGQKPRYHRTAQPGETVSCVRLAARSDRSA